MDFDDERPRTSSDDDSGISNAFRRRGSGSEAKPWLFATGAASLVGALFAGVSTHDFITHLDRQVHTIHCSFIPGAGANLGESGCRAVMMSPYSSLFRKSLWGGLPISLLALAVFAYLAYRAIDFALDEDLTKKDTKFLIAGSLLPVLMSGIYGYISAVELDALCKLCAGVYVSSILTLVFAILAHGKAPDGSRMDEAGGRYARWFAEGVLYVGALAGLYIAFAPTSAKSSEGCGALVKTDDPNGVIIPLMGRSGGAPSIAVLDPLCPACKGFDERLEASGLVDQLNMRAVLFPLDSTCNWMVKTSLHPGACAVSEAMLCDKDNAREILSWAFANQEELRKQAESNESAMRQKIGAQFPKVKSCLGSPAIKNKVNKSLRWAVANALPVLTPQLFIGDRRVCDEDTDLGLEYTITRMLETRTSKKAEVTR